MAVGLNSSSGIVVEVVVVGMVVVVHIIVLVGTT